MRYIKRYAGIVLISIILTNCGIFKKKETQTVSKFAKELIAGLTKNYYVGEALKITGKIKYSDANSNISANIKSFWKPDSFYYSTFSLFGLEGAKMLITKKQIKLINRLHKKAYILEVKELLAQYGIPLSYNELEKILIGEFPIKWAEKSDIKNTANGFALYGIYDNISYKTEISKQTYHINYIQLKSGKYTVTIKYEEYKPFVGHLFPTRINIDASGPRDVSISMNINKFVSLKNIPKLKFTIPKGYEVIHEIK